jgi:hypothetical protein
MTISIMIKMITVATLIETRRWRAAESFLENPWVRIPKTKCVTGQRRDDENDARKLDRFIYPIGELCREALLQILSTPRHLAKVAEKEKRHAEIYAALPTNQIE